MKPTIDELLADLEPSPVKMVTREDAFAEARRIGIKVTAVAMIPVLVFMAVGLVLEFNGVVLALGGWVVGDISGWLTRRLIAKRWRREELADATRARICRDLVPFTDGELPRERADAFRAHLLPGPTAYPEGCEPCRLGLIRENDLTARLSTLKRKLKQDGGV